MRSRFAALVVLPLLVLACSGDDDAEETARETPTTSAPTATSLAGPPDDLCQVLNRASAPDTSDEERDAAFAQLHSGLADAEPEVHDAVSTLQSELEDQEDGEALHDAMEILNDEMGCGG